MELTISASNNELMMAMNNSHAGIVRPNSPLRVEQQKFNGKFFSIFLLSYLS